MEISFIQSFPYTGLQHTTRAVDPFPYTGLQHTTGAVDSFPYIGLQHTTGAVDLFPYTELQLRGMDPDKYKNKTRIRKKLPEIFNCFFKSKLN